MLNTNAVIQVTVNISNRINGTLATPFIVDIFAIPPIIMFNTYENYTKRPARRLLNHVTNKDTLQGITFMIFLIKIISKKKDK